MSDTGDSKNPTHQRVKYRQLKERLSEENWPSWKREISAVLRDRDLDDITFGYDIRPAAPPAPPAPSGQQQPPPAPPEDASQRQLRSTTIQQRQRIMQQISSGSGPIRPIRPVVTITDEQREWDDKNKAAYNQVLLNITTILQPLLDGTDDAYEAWTVLLETFESPNASLLALTRAKYENHKYQEGQSMLAYIAKLTEYWNHLQLLGDFTSKEIHAERMLMNLPNTSDWMQFSMTVRSISKDPIEVARRLNEKYAFDKMFNKNQGSSNNVTALHSNEKSTRGNGRGRGRGNGRGRGGRQGGRTDENYEVPTCDYCSKRGHIEDECYKKAYDTLHPKESTPSSTSNTSSTNAKPTSDNSSNSNKPQSRSKTTKDDSSYIAKLDSSFQKHLSLLALGPFLNVPEYDSVDTFSTSITETKAILQEVHYPTVNLSDDNSHLYDSVENFAGIATLAKPPKSKLSTDETLEEWCIDSGATSHLCNNRESFARITTIEPVAIDTASGHRFQVMQKGDIYCTLRSYHETTEPDVTCVLHDVLFVPRLSINLLSVARLTNADIEVKFGKSESTIYITANHAITGNCYGNLYILDTLPHKRPLKLDSIAALSAPIARNLHIWHLRLNHINYRTIKRMTNLNYLIGLSPSHVLKNEEETLCVECPFGKQTRAPFEEGNRTFTEIGALIHSDYIGKFNPSNSNSIYALTWIDEHSKYATINFTKDCTSKTTSKLFEDFISFLKNQTGKTIKILRTDNDGA